MQTRLKRYALRFFVRAYGHSWLPDSVCRWCVRRLTGFKDADEI